MKTPILHCRDGRIFTIEDGINPKPKIQSSKYHINIFKWFIGINIILLLIFCGYALWSLYQLEDAMQSRDVAINLSRYFERYDPKSQSLSIEPHNESAMISDFQEWRKSILKTLEDLKDNGKEKINEAQNLKFLLHTISGIIKNLLDDHNNLSNSSTILNNGLTITNLTDLEVHILKEFTKLKIQESDVKSRFPRTIKGDENDSGCDVQFSIKITNNNEPVKINVIPTTKGNGMINIRNDINYSSKEKSVSKTQECSFNIVYKS